jgi:type II secretory pathway component GspD/PulD (secretin)
MKIRLCLLITVGAFLAAWQGGAQQTPPAAEPVPPAPAIEDPASPVLPEAEPIDAPVEAAPAEEPAAPPELPPLDPTGPLDQGDVEELLTLDEVPLPDAIRNLARLANINFQFDPKVLHRPPGPDGTVPPHPTVSFRWENVTAMQALFAVLANHDLQIVQDPKTKIARITPKDPAALEPLISKIVKLQNSQPSTNLVTILKSTVGPRSQILIDQRTSQVLLIATEKEMVDLESLLSRLDSPSGQILIEARIMETLRGLESLKGIDWSGTLRNQNVMFGNGVTVGQTTTTAPGAPVTTPISPTRTVTTTPSADVRTDLTTLIGTGAGNIGESGFPGLSLDTARGFHPSTAFLNADGVKAVLSFLNQDSDTENIATPRAVALDGHPTELSVVRNIPVFEEEQGIVGAGGSQAPSTVKPNYDVRVGDTTLNEVGIKLIVVPRIVGETNVLLDLRPEVSDRAGDEEKVLGNRRNQAPIFSRSKVSTQAIVPSGNTLVLGGLNQNQLIKSHTKVPILGDIPILGLAFRKDGKTRFQRNLIIFITPTIVGETDFHPTVSNFLHTRQGDHRAEPEDSAWDSGKPYDWTKPRRQ